jgi:hypothetical protein
VGVLVEVLFRREEFGELERALDPRGLVGDVVDAQRFGDRVVDFGGRVGEVGAPETSQTVPNASADIFSSAASPVISGVVSPVTPPAEFGWLVA